MESKPDMLVLGEIFVCPYGKQFFDEYFSFLFGLIVLKSSAAENIDWPEEKRPALSFLRNFSLKNSVYIVGGSIPEKTEKGIYNTCFVFDRKGEVIAKHRKVHLFDVDIPGKYKFLESEIFLKGENMTIFDTDFAKIGLGICFDVRIPEYSLSMAKKGAEMLIFPSAFSPATGPLHWEILAKGRAVDCQAYILMPSPARPVDDPSLYQTYAHSMFVNPWGKVEGSLGIEPGLLIQTFDGGLVAEARNAIPRKTQLCEIKCLV